MRQIFKYILNSNFADPQKLALPRDAQFCHADMDTRSENLALWFDVVPGRTHVERTFRVYGTGWPINPDDKFLASVKCGEFIWHVFEVVE